MARVLARPFLERVLHEPREGSAVAFEYRLEDGRDARLTWNALRSEARRLAAGFEERLPPRAPVVLACTHGPEFPLLLLAALLSGRPAIPAALSPFLPPEGNVARLIGLARASGAGAVFLSGQAERLAPFVSQALSAFEATARASVVTFSETVAWPARDIPFKSPADDEVAIIQFTSGSSGTPRGVKLSHGNLTHQSAVIEARFGHDSTSSGAIWLPHFHNTGLIGGVLQPLYVGMRCTYMSPAVAAAKPDAWLRLLSETKATTSGGPNFIFDACTARVPDEMVTTLDLSNWRVAFMGAEPISPVTLERFASKFAPAGFRKEAFLPLYGLTENTLLVTAASRSVPTKVTEHAGRSLVSVGSVIDGHELVIVDPDSGRPRAEGEEGEIWVAGPSVAKGYAGGTPEDDGIFQARVAISRGPGAAPGKGAGSTRTYLRTGDLGFQREGQLYVTGRRKDTLILAGRKFHALDLEHTLKARIPELATRPFAVVASSEGGAAERLVLVTEWASEGEGPDARTSVRPGTDFFTRAAAALAAGNEAPLFEALFVEPGRLPRTDSAKIQRFAVRKGLEQGTLTAWDSMGRAGVRNGARERGSAAAPRVDAATALDMVCAALAEELGVSPSEVAPGETFASLGLTSMMAYKVAARLEERFSCSIPPTLFFETPTPGELADAIIESLRTAARPPPLPAPAPAARTPRSAPGEPRDEGSAGAAATGIDGRQGNTEETFGPFPGMVERRRTERREPWPSEDVAIVGYALRFPGADSPEEYWSLLMERRCAVGEIPKERWDNDAIHDPEPRRPGKTYTRHGGFLKSRVDLFDAGAFGFSAREADATDPQQRILLETTLAALENAGLGYSGLRCTRTGVVVGVSSWDYSRLAPPGVSEANAYSGLGNAHSICANRISHVFKLEGPSMAVDTACSSSLVALHVACESLRSKETDYYVVGGVNLLLAPELQVAFSQAQMLSPDGLVRAFDDNANGYVRAEGVGVVLVMRVPDAVRKGMRIRAIIKATAVNQDGPSNGITAPNGKAQEKVVRLAWERAAERGVPTDDIAYVEAHGTGTRLGDPIEFHALARVLALEGRETACYVGSVKSNLGHLEAAAGMASLLKGVLSLEHGMVPPSLHFGALNRNISSEAAQRLHVLTEPLPLDTGKRNVALGLSSFGFGGTNAHVVLAPASHGVPNVLAESSKATRADPTRKSLPLVFSAPSEIGLRAFAGRLAGWITCEEGRKARPEELGSLLARTRTGFSYRAALMLPPGRQARQVAADLREFSEGRPDAPVLSSDEHPAPRKVAFVFTGQGANLRGAATALHARNPVFREALERAFAVAEGRTRVPLREILLGAWDDERASTPTDLAQPALFAFQTALLRAWRDLGVEPQVVLGHSVGEFAAAEAAGLLPLDVAMGLVIERGTLMQALEGEGAMAAVFLPEEEVRAHLTSWDAPETSRLDVATVNGPDLTVVGGHADAVEAFARAMETTGARVQRVAVGRGFHSPHMDACLDDWERVAQAALADVVSENAPASEGVTFLSTVDARSRSHASCLDADHWRRHARSTTRFWDTVIAATKHGVDTFVEVGPDASLTAMLRKGFRGDTARQARCLASYEKSTPREVAFEQAAARLWVNGWSVEWERALGPAAPGAFDLPLTPLQRKRHWYGKHTHSAAPVPIATTTPTRAEASPHSPHPEEPVPGSPKKQGKTDAILADLVTLLAGLLGKKEGEVKPDMALLELGADSLVLMDALKVVEDKYSVSIPVARMFADLSTTRALADFLSFHAHEEVAPPESAASTANASAAPAAMARPPEVAPSAGPSAIHEPVSSPSLPASPASPDALALSAVAGVPSDLATLFAQQLQLMHAQLAVLTGAGAAPQRNTTNAHAAPVAPAASTAQAAPAPLASSAPALATADVPVKDRFNAMMPEKSITVAPLEPRKQKHLDELVAAFTARTKGSKEHTQKYRKVLAENRASAGFRVQLKEMVYPIVLDRSQGAHIWDVDGNEYVDITMGFGVNLFGHNDPALVAAIEAQLRKGVAVGPQSFLAGEVADLFTRLIGLDRVVFTNSGTEAVMTAVRLARAGTGRRTIVLFANSYHGTFDGILARSRKTDPERKGTPVAPGIPSALVDDVVVLDYGTDEALSHIERLGSRVASVLVEPVQSRHPELQPREFLRSLREITQRHGAALIFDEVITGLRTGQGGAQEHFGVRADLATYGKVLGGGMPIGAVAGSSRYLDAVDGGWWRYGDASVPPAELTFFAGTFCKHPLAMAAARATLSRLLEGGGAIQRELGAHTAGLCERLNAFIASRGYPSLAVHSFGSLFRFVFRGNMDLFFYHLNLRGIYVWEGRNLFLSTAHDQEDLARIERAVCESLLAMEEGGFLEGKGSAGQVESVAAARATSPVPAVTGSFALTSSQKRFSDLSLARADGHMAAVIPLAVRFRGQPSGAALEEAFLEVQRRHDSLRLRYAPDFSRQELPVNAALAPLARIDLQELDSADRHTRVKRFLREEACRPFDLVVGPPLRGTAISVYENEIVFVLSVHHCSCDGIGAARILTEMAEIYNARVEGRAPRLEAVAPFTRTLAAYPEWIARDIAPRGEEAWRALYPERIDLFELGALRKASPTAVDGTLAGAREHLDVKASVLTELKKLGAETGTTLFMNLLASFGALLGCLTGARHVVLPVPLAARGHKGTGDQVANWVNLIPLPLHVEPAMAYVELLARTRATMMVAYANMDYPAQELLDWLRSSGRLPADLGAFPQVTFNLEPAPKAPKFANVEASLQGFPVVASEFPMMINITEIAGLLLLDADYQIGAFAKSDVALLLERYRTFLERVARGGKAQTLDELSRFEERAYDAKKERWKKRISSLG